MHRASRIVRPHSFSGFRSLRIATLQLTEASLAEEPVSARTGLTVDRVRGRRVGRLKRALCASLRAGCEANRSFLRGQTIDVNRCAGTKERARHKQSLTQACAAVVVDEVSGRNRARHALDALVLLHAQQIVIAALAAGQRRAALRAVGHIALCGIRRNENHKGTRT